MVPPTGSGAVSTVEGLEALREAGLYRRMRTVEGCQGPRIRLDDDEVLLLCSNNYLGLAEDPRVREAGATAYREQGAGAGGSRLVSGNMAAHESLERGLARFHERESALLFGSGYLANCGIVSALAHRGEVVYSDELNHASIIDGCRLAGAATFVYRHRDVEHLGWAMERAAAPAALIVTDGIFSMDGDVAPLSALVELARRHGARLMVDEAHAVGAFGPGGRGSVAEAGLAGEVDVVCGTLGKALGSYGAYAAGDRRLRELLTNTVRPLIFSTGLPPACAAAAEAALEIVWAEPDRALRLQENAAGLRDALRGRGLATGASRTQIIPILLGEPERAVEACSLALENGVYAQAIRPPTVPEGTSRLRLSVMASHEPGDLRRAAAVIAAAVAEATGPGPPASGGPPAADEIRITDLRPRGPGGDPGPG